MVMYRSVQIMGYTDDIKILGRSRMAGNEVYTALENQAVTVGLNINTYKTKAIIQTRKQMREKAIHLNNMNIEILDSFIYLGSITLTNNNEIMEIKRRILMANRAYFSSINLFKTRTIH
jgi:hypothetical protein